MSIETKLAIAVSEAILKLYGQEVSLTQIQLSKTKKEFEGHLTLVVFPFLKISKKNPEQTAQEIGAYLQENEPAIAAFNVIKGFLNLVIDAKVWINLLQTVADDDKFGITTADDNSPLVMIEYSSPT